MKTPPSQSRLKSLRIPLSLALLAGVSSPAALAEAPAKSAAEIQAALNPEKPLTRSMKKAPVEKRGGVELSATRSLAAVSVAVDPQARVTLPNIQFKLNSATELANNASKDQLAALAAALKNSPGSSFLIEGHTCSIGSDEANNRLSAERAEFVEKALVAAGVPASSLRAIGCGEAEPHRDQVSPDAGEARLAPYRKVMIHKIATE